jgi:hypothetical protein
MICTLLSLSIIIFLLSSSSGDGNSLTINYKHFFLNKKLTNSPLNTVFLSERELPILVFAIYKDTWLGRQSSVQLSDTLTMRLMVSTLSESIGHVRSFSLSGPTGCWWTYFTHNSFVLVIYGITQFEFRRYRFVFIFLEKQIIGLEYLIMYCFRKWKCHFSDTI